MNQGLVRIILSVAIISIVGYSATLASYYLQSAEGLDEGSLVEKGLELGSSLFANGTTVIRGISTGSHRMSTFYQETGLVSISLSGDSVSWTFPRNAIIVSNLTLHWSDDEASLEVSGSPVLVYGCNGSLLICPQVKVSYERDSGDISGRIVHHALVSSCYLSNFTTSGRFDILKETQEVVVRHYQRECLYDCTVTVSVDGEEAASFQARAGEIVLVVSAHYNVMLEPMPRQ